MIADKDSLGRRVEWGGQTWEIIGVHFDPVFVLMDESGERVWVSADRVRASAE